MDGQPRNCPECGRQLTYALNKENGVVVALDQIIPVFRASREPDGTITCMRDLNAMPIHFNVCKGVPLTRRRRRHV